MSAPEPIQLAAERARIEAIAAGALAPPPGEPLFPTATPGKLHGRYANCTVGGVMLFVVEWDVEVIGEYADVTAHGDYWRQRLSITQDWQGRVRGYFTASGAAAATYMHAGTAAVAAQPQLTLTCYSDMTLSAGTPIFAGIGYASRTRFSAPFRAMATQEYEIMAATGPTTI